MECINQVDLEKLKGNQERLISRVDVIEKKSDILNSLAVSISEMSVELRYMRQDTQDLKEQIKEDTLEMKKQIKNVNDDVMVFKTKGSDKYEILKDRVMWAVVGALILGVVGKVMEVIF